MNGTEYSCSSWYVGCHVDGGRTLVSDLTRFGWLQHSGGNPEAELQYAAIIIADPDTEVFDQLIERYEGVPEGKYVESYLWVQTCVDRNRLEYSSAGDSGSDTMDTGDSASDDSTSHT